MLFSNTVYFILKKLSFPTFKSVPDFGVRACLNSKLARCTVTLRENGKSRVLTTANRAAFEILCDENDARVGLIGGFSA